MYDVIIVGGGPAGLSAALVLGRCRRKILVCDTGRQRNAASRGLHGYLTRDGIVPSDFLRLGREELQRYGVECRDIEVTAANCCDGGGFEVLLADGACLRSRKLLIATGVVDHIPELEGIAEFYGCSVFHCPYCDGWEVRDQPLAAYGDAGHAGALSLSLKTWSEDVILCTDGRPAPRGSEAARLRRHGVPVYPERIARLEGHHGVLERIVFANGESVACRAMFFSTGQVQRSPLAERLGCEFNEKGTIRTNRREGTHIPGLYVAGDASRDVQFVIVAAAEGAKAAVAINKTLEKELG